MALSRLIRGIRRYAPLIRDTAEGVDAIRMLKGKAPKFSIPAAVLSGIASPNSGESAAEGQQTQAERQLVSNISRTKRGSKRMAAPPGKRRKSRSRKAVRGAAAERAYIRSKPRTPAGYDNGDGNGKRRARKKRSGPRKFSAKQLASQRAFAARNRGRKGKAR